MEFAVQGHHFHADIFLLPLRRSDIVLGIQWLQELGPIQCDFKNLTMDFMVGDQSYHLEGRRETEILSASIHSMERLIQNSPLAVLMQIEAAKKVELKLHLLNC